MNMISIVTMIKVNEYFQKMHLVNLISIINVITYHIEVCVLPPW